METFEIMSCDDAIALLQRIKKQNKDCRIVVTSFDFSNGNTQCKSETPDKVCILIENSNTVILNRDDFIPHMQLYSRHQIPQDIIREGIMHDVLLRI